MDGSNGEYVQEYLEKFRAFADFPRGNERRGHGQPEGERLQQRAAVDVLLEFMASKRFSSTRTTGTREEASTVALIKLFYDRRIGNLDRGLPGLWVNVHRTKLNTRIRKPPFPFRRCGRTARAGWRTNKENGRL